MAEAAGRFVVIITGDKDLMQLVDDRTSLLDEMRMGRGAESSEVRRAQVIEKFGVPPERVADVLALAGDSSDNVPGVDGIGEKTAAELVNAYGDLEAVLSRVDDIKQSSRREKLRAQADNARLSKRLVVIRDDVDLSHWLPRGLDDIVYGGPDRPALQAFFAELEFRRLVNDPFVREADPADAPAADAVPAAVVQTVIDRTKYRAVTDAAGLRELITCLGGVARFAVRTEVDRLGAPDAKLVGVGVSFCEGEASWLPAASLGADELRAALAPLLADTGKQIVAHDGKTDVNALFFAGYPTWRLAGDPMLAAYLLDADAETPSLSNLARRVLGHMMLEPDDVLGAGKAAVTLDQVPLEQQTQLVGEAVDCTLRTAAILEPRVVAAGLDTLYRGLELPLEALLGEMERAGIRVDTARLNNMSDDFTTALADISARAMQVAGKPFNLESPKQVAELLFKDLGLPITKRTATGPSTDASVLEALADKHELPALILEHRTLAKLKGTYVDVLPLLIDARGRVHTHFNQAVTATGRLSSTDPNLQNIPVRTALGRKIRDAFIADEGNVLLSLDYSQIELRILAHVTDDEVLLDAFRRNEDVHRRTAGEIFGVPYDVVTKDQRNAAKAINFGLLYGMGFMRLAREIGVPRATAREYHERYHARLVGVRDWQNRQREQAYSDKEVRTLLGRRRHLHGIDSKNGGVRAQAERLATNTPIQGSAADIMKRAMIDVDRALKRDVPRARILLQVHDELVIEVPEGDAAAALEVSRQAMVAAASLKVPLVVDGHQGKTWNEAH
jgi:DNA polymerase-1